MSHQNPLRDLPRVDDLLEELRGRLPDLLLVEVIRGGLDQTRDRLRSGESIDARSVIGEMVRRIDRLSTMPVINGTGVLLHTNLGRARWSRRAIDAAALAASATTNLEVDIDSGDRSRRGGYVTELLRALTDAEDALIVNNNASALFIALAATSAGLSVPVARGELIEIGGSYRLPEVMAASGTSLVEVGTTNRVRVDDYRTAAQLHRLGALLKVHPSNYRVEGFTSQVSVADLAGVAAAEEVPLIHDIGSGLLDSDTPWLDGPTPEFLSGEPAARQSIADGANVVTFSGDKLLGGPQAGIILGSQSTIDVIRRHPLARALRVDGVVLAALAATLEAYASGTVAEIPFWAQATIEEEVLQSRSEHLAEAVGARVARGESTVGGGSVPGLSIPGPIVVIEGRDDLFECLLATETPVLARRAGGDLIIDLRTVDSQDDSTLADVVKRCL